MKVAVLGASGYLAKRVIETLAAAGHDVVGLSRTREDLQTDARSKTYSLENLRVVLTSLESEIVINMTNHFARSSTTEDVLAMVNVNCALVTELANASLESGTVVMHIGSAWEFDHTRPEEGQDLYGLLKSLAVHVLDWFALTRQLKVYHIKLYDTYGPSDPRRKIIQLILGQLDAEEPLEMSEGNQILELVHVDDVALAVLMAVEDVGRLLQREWDFRSRNIYWCRPAEPTTLREIAALVEEATGKDLRIRWGQRPYRPGEQFARTAQLRPQVPGWSPTIGLGEGLNQLIKNSNLEFE